MMRRYLMILGALSGLVGPLRAQNPAPDPMRGQELRQMIEDRFAARVQEELGLNDAQAARMRVTVRQYFAKRRALEADERALRSAMSGQLRPGVAADQDSVARLMNAIIDVKQRYLETYRDELKDMSGYLNPVQRAQFFVMRERLLDRVRAAREQMGQEGARQRRFQP
jgi:hypothetical protein